MTWPELTKLPEAGLALLLTLMTGAAFTGYDTGLLVPASPPSA